MSSRVLAAAVLVAACSSAAGPARVGQAPSWRKPRVVEASVQTAPTAPITFAPGGGGGDGVVILALQGSNLETRPIPRALVDGGTIHLDGALRDPFKNPEVFVTREDGTVIQPATQASATEFHAAVDCPREPGRLQ